MHELRIVVGDDQALMRNALRFALEADGGCSVAAEASSGAELLEILRRVEADVVLMDLTMPPMDGLECLEHLREEHPELVLIVVSGCDDPRQIDAAFRRGANAFVLKSIDPVRSAGSHPADHRGQRIRDGANARRTPIQRTTGAASSRSENWVSSRTSPKGSRTSRSRPGSG